MGLYPVKAIIQPTRLSWVDAELSLGLAISMVLVEISLGPVTALLYFFIIYYYLFI